MKLNPILPPLFPKLPLNVASRVQGFLVTALLAGGATVPFVARYHKEATGSRDEVCHHGHP